jgi:hypothetical protein
MVNLYTPDPKYTDYFDNVNNKDKDVSNLPIHQPITPPYKQNYNNVNNKNISLDQLLTPQYDNNYNDNSVYNPNTKLGRSVFKKDSLNYYLDQVEKTNQQKVAQKAKQKNNGQKNIYIIIGIIAISYLTYRFI